MMQADLYPMTFPFLKIAGRIMAEPIRSDVDSATTGDLLKLIRNGDQGALDRLCRRLMPRMKAWATGRLPLAARDVRDTDDLVQETLIRTIARLEGFENRGDGALEAYLMRGIINGIRTEIRRRSRRQVDHRVPEDLVSPDPSPLENAVGNDVVRRYETALERLDSTDRDAILYRVEMGLDYNEIAEVLGKPSRDAARMTVTRALLKLAREMGDGD